MGPGGRGRAASLNPLQLVPVTVTPRQVERTVSVLVQPPRASQTRSPGLEWDDRPNAGASEPESVSVSLSQTPS